MNKNIIDVIIPAYLPSEKYIILLNRALKSLENQTFKNFEVILILNGLYDTKDNIIKNIKFNGKLEIYHLEGKKSAAIARNFGIKNSKSKYIAQLDADDQYCDTKLEKQYNFMENNNDYDIVGTLAYDLIDGNLSDSCFEKEKYKSHEEIKNIIFNENIMCNGSVMLKKESIDKYNLYYEEKYKPGDFWPQYNSRMWEDWDLWIRAIKSGCKFYNLQERLYIWSANTSVER